MTNSTSDAAQPVEARQGSGSGSSAAAAQLLHQQGIERTTLADIAKVADVPAGNVYYYFKTKDEVRDVLVGSAKRPEQVTDGL